MRRRAFRPNTSTPSDWPSVDFSAANVSISTMRMFVQSSRSGLTSTLPVGFLPLGLDDPRGDLSMPAASRRLRTAAMNPVCWFSVACVSLPIAFAC